MPTEPAAAVRARDLTVTFGQVTVLDQLNLCVPEGKITVLLGANGAGKTTLLRCLTAVVSATHGEVRLLGESPVRAIAEGRVGVMPQNTAAWSGVRPVELLRYLAGMHFNPLPVDELASALGIDTFATTTYRRLSGGQRQAVNLAGALIGRPELVLLDEPTAGMDVHLRRTVLAMIEALRASGVSVLVSTHDMSEAARLADRVAVIDHGRMIAEGTVGELTADSADLEEAFVAMTRRPDHSPVRGGPR